MRLQVQKRERKREITQDARKDRIITADRKDPSHLAHTLLQYRYEGLRQGGLENTRTGPNRQDITPITAPTPPKGYQQTTNLLH